MTAPDCASIAAGAGRIALEIPLERAQQPSARGDAHSRRAASDSTRALWSSPTMRRFAKCSQLFDQMR
jgi:hypothetical protein